MASRPKIDVVASVTGAFAFLRNHPWLVLRLYWFPLFVGSIVVLGSWIALIELAIDPVGGTNNTENADLSANDDVIWAFLLMPVSAIIANIAITFFIAIPLIPLTKYIVSNEPVSRFPLFFKVDRIVVAVWGALALQVLIVMLLQLSIFASQFGFLILPVTANTDTSHSEAIIAFVFGIAVLMILGVRLSILPTATATDGRIRFAATWRLTRGNGLRLFACFILWYAILYAVILGLTASMFIAGLVIYLIAALLSVSKVAFPILMLLAFVLGSLSFLTIFAASQTALGALIYRQLAGIDDETATSFDS